MLQSWLTKIRDVRGSYRQRKHRSGTGSDRSPSILSKSVSLRRANRRALQHSRPDSSLDPLPDAHTRLSKSINALYVLSSLANGETIRPLLGSGDCQNGSCNSEDGDHVQIDKVAALLIQERAHGNVDLWDREFSSMSSYGSEEQQQISGKMQTAQESKRQNRAVLSANSICEDDSEDFGRVLDIDSSCSEVDSRDVVVNSNCACEESWLDHELQKFSAASSNHKPVDFSVHRRHRSSSISAVLPSDLQGVVGDSIALVKVSHNPYEDFRESMYQMIMEEDLEKSMDMEELLYCYLSLNSPEHHELIEEVFSDVWSTILMSLR